VKGGAALPRGRLRYAARVTERARQRRHAARCGGTRWLGAALLAVVALLGAARGEAGPAKEYRVQEPVLCASGQGCPRMLRNAVDHAGQYCQAEGGVLDGGSKRDFRCEQRGIYCVVTGRIECRGRFDPRQPPGQSRAEDRTPPARTRTCLDAACDRFVSHAPGPQEQGTHACPAGFWAAGVSGTGNNLVCQAGPRAVEAPRIDTATRREGLRACPPGMLLRGVDADRTRLLCAPPAARVGGERVQDESGNLGLQVCTGPDGDYAASELLTGVDVAREKILCARAEAR